MPLIEKAIGKIDSSESYHIRAIQDLHEIQEYYQCSEADIIAVILIATNNDKLKTAIKEGIRKGHSLKEVLQMRFTQTFRITKNQLRHQLISATQKASTEAFISYLDYKSKELKIMDITIDDHTHPL